MVLNFHGNGSIVDVAGLKRQAQKDTGRKLQAQSGKPQRRRLRFDFFDGLGRLVASLFGFSC